MTFVNLAHSQKQLEYFELINKAEMLNLDGKSKVSDSIYRVAFSLVEKPFKEDYFLAALNADKLKNNQLVYSYLLKAIENGLLLDRIKKTKITYFKKSEYYKKIKEVYSLSRENYLNSLNLNLRNEIEKMVLNDQKARKPIFGGWKQMKKVDSYNFKRLLQIIKENDNKWPGFSIIGENTPKGKYDVTGNIVLMLLHFKKEQIQKLKPFMLKAVLEGEMYPYHYARIIDYKYFGNRVKIIKTKKGKKEVELCSLYGTYAESLICNCKEAEQERKKIGFEPLQDYYRKIGSTYKCKEE